MTVLWPRLPSVLAAQEYDQLAEGGPVKPRASHPAQVFTPVGGGRAGDREVQDLIDALQSSARAFGFPEPAGDAQRVAFDREAAQILSSKLRLSWAEGSSKDVWSFLALVALPDLTLWRFGIRNRERWVASDITRHTWSRLWWQAVVFESDPELLGQLSESDLNQLLERRRIGGDPRLATSLARAIVDATPDGGSTRRLVVRESTARLRRRLAYLDVRSLSEGQVRHLCATLVAASLPQAPGHVQPHD